MRDSPPQLFPGSRSQHELVGRPRNSALEVSTHTYIYINSEAMPHLCNHSSVLRERFSTIGLSSAKNLRIQTKFGRKKLRHKGNPQEIWGPIACVAPPRRDFFVCLYVASPFDPLRTEKNADFGVASRDPTANLCPSSKIQDFFMRRRRGSKKCVDTLTLRG